MKNFRQYLPQILIIILFISAFFIWYFIYFHQHNNYLKVAFLDVGQGDSIYIEAPNGKQMLIDGGPDTKVLSRLAEVMPFGDRSIDLILATHNDSDHIGGLPYVLDHYKVGNIIENGVIGTTKIYQNLDNKIKNNNIGEIVARRGMHIILDQEKNIYLDILFPDRDVTSFDSNDGSIVGRLVYGNESFMLTGDATKYTEYLIMHNENSSTLHANILKLGHHGSKYSSGELWLEAVHPDMAIISAGKNNRYGHPNQEVLDRLNALHIPYLSTIKKGTIIFETDGAKMLTL
ncbi:MAG TPA: ComEC/Rec2 family competence protein [Candidatus Paceibacterota bacterium]|jgi:competence protein ComEC|nr:ComEC/Rec2 family competence protein [Candidatus Paceibacterota bacterium]